MERICRAAEGAINYGRDIPASASWGRGDRYDAVTHAACELAEDLEAEAILTSTQTGLSCIRVARFRPPNKILAISPIEHTVRMLALVWGVTSIRGEQAGSLEDRFQGAVEAAREGGSPQGRRRDHPDRRDGGVRARLDERRRGFHRGRGRIEGAW